MTRPPARPLATWFYVVLGIIGVVILVVAIVVAIVDPTQEVLTGLATVLIPVALVGLEAARQYIKRRRRR